MANGIGRIDGPGGTDPGEGGTVGAVLGLLDRLPQGDLRRLECAAKHHLLAHRMRGAAGAMTDDELRGWRLAFGRWGDDPTPLCDLAVAIVGEVTGTDPGRDLEAAFPHGAPYGVVLAALADEVDRESEDRGLE